MTPTPSVAPRIDPVPPGVARPFWSVMIPTFNCARLLVETLRGVLAQDPGPRWLQIEVVDDCSTRDDPAQVVREVGRGRVGFHRQPHNVGVARNFNACLRRATGHLVHVLHGDDRVLPGFYERVELAAHRHPEVGFLYARTFITDEAGGIEALGPRVPALERPSRDAGPFLYGNVFFTPGVVVRRAFYEAQGGFLEHLVHTADWEMWVRAIAGAGGLVLNEPLACYRMFAANDTGRLARGAENLRDWLRAGAVFAARYRGFDPARFREAVAWNAGVQAQRFRRQGDLEAALANEALARELKGG